MRWYILRILLHKELHRHLANRGGLVLAALLVVAALLLSLFGREDAQTGGLMTGVQHCFVDYWEDGPLVRHLMARVPPELQGHIRFRPAAQATLQGNTIVYPPGTGAIQLRPVGGEGRGPGYKVWFWHPGKDGSALAPFEAWFWREAHRHLLGTTVRLAKSGPALQGQALVPILEEERSELRGGLDARSGTATAIVMFAIFFVCIYLLPSLTCEERERGVLLAQALSPASSWEILAAKFLFYPAAGIGLAALLAGIYNPAVLGRLFFWLALAVAAVGSLGVGLTIASLARTQRAASMGALCYMLAVSLLLFICQQSRIPGLPYLTLEYHCPRMLHAVLADALAWYHWFNLAGAALLATGWAIAANVLFRRHGWQ